MARVMSEFTENEQNRMVVEYEQLPLGGRGKWLESQGVTRPSFYERRARILAASKPKRGRSAGGKNKSAELFTNADDATQRRLMAEYDALRDEEKAAWRETHQMTLAMVSYYRRKQARTPPSNGTSTALVRHSPADIERLIPVTPLKPHSAATIHSPSFDDAISVLTVKRDMYHKIYTEIIDDLTRMKR